MPGRCGGAPARARLDLCQYPGAAADADGARSVARPRAGRAGDPLRVADAAGAKRARRLPAAGDDTRLSFGDRRLVDRGLTQIKRPAPDQERAVFGMISARFRAVETTETNCGRRLACGR